MLNYNVQRMHKLGIELFFKDFFGKEVTIPDDTVSKILESCVDPGHRATKLVKIRSAVHIACTFMEKYPFLLRYTSASSPPGDIIGMCVQSMAPTTAGKAPISKKLRLTVGKSDGKHINTAFLFAMHLDMRGIILHTVV